ncbi:transcription repressor MYB6 [Spatholobus suberectus]|nr:transcription repressor MYB6 [Spatholobus suberectus]
MAQWESARLEAEARFSNESSRFSHNTNPNNSFADNKTIDSDYFLRIWTSKQSMLLLILIFQRTQKLICTGEVWAPRFSSELDHL